MDRKQVENYLRNQCSPEEADRIIDWFQTEEGERYLNELLEKDIQNFEEFKDYFVYPEIRSEKTFENILDASQKKPEPIQIGSRSKRKYIWMAAAASVILLVSVLFTFQFLTVEESATDSPRTVTVMKGEKKTIRLQDGSRVRLNSDSRLTIPNSFSANKRRVKLSGQAYFEVEASKNRPFIVISGDSYTKVLGTKFDVNAYPEYEQIEVAVREGSVEVGSLDKGSNAKNISANQIGIYSIKKQDTDVKAARDLSRYLGWTEGKLIFRNTSLQEVANKLERWYGINCEIENSALGSKEFTSTFDKEPLQEVLNIIALSMNITYKKEQGNVIFKK